MFTDTLTRWCEALVDTKNAYAFRKVLEPVFDRMSSVALSSPGLVIHGAGSTLAKTGGSTSYFIVNGVLRSIAAATDMPALSGTVVNGTFNVFCFFIDSAGTTTSAMGTAGSTLALLTFPQFPKQKALIGFIIINPTGTGNFVGGTTALDDGTVVPNAAYVNGPEGFDPYVLIGGA